MDMYSLHPKLVAVLSAAVLIAVLLYYNQIYVNEGNWHGMGRIQKMAYDEDRWNREGTDSAIIIDFFPWKRKSRNEKFKLQKKRKEEHGWARSQDRDGTDTVGHR